jgi:hypothetical protein
MADPVSLALIGSAVGAAGGLGASLLSKGSQPPGPTAPPPAAPPIQQPQGTPGGAAATSGGGTSAPSFIGASSLPQQQGYGAKTLLGQ